MAAIDSRALAFQTLRRLGAYSRPSAVEGGVNNAASAGDAAGIGGSSGVSLARARDTQISDPPCTTPAPESGSHEIPQVPNGTIPAIREWACPHVDPGNGWFLTSGRVVCAACFKERRRREERQGHFFASIADMKAFAAEQRRRRRASRGEPEDDD